MKRSPLILPVVLLVAALSLSACGGGGSSTSGAEGSIEATITSAATTQKPSKCTELQTEEFNEQETGTPGAKAEEVCEERAAEQEEPAESVDISEIDVEGEKATADAELHGSALNGQTIELELVEEGGKWKLNQFLSFAKFDADALGEGFEKGLENAGEASASQIKCLSEGVRGLSQEEAEEVAFESNLKPLEEHGCE